MCKLFKFINFNEMSTVTHGIGIQFNSTNIVLTHSETFFFNSCNCGRQWVK